MNLLDHLCHPVCHIIRTCEIIKSVSFADLGTDTTNNDGKSRIRLTERGLSCGMFRSNIDWLRPNPGLNRLRLNAIYLQEAIPKAIDICRRASSCSESNAEMLIDAFQSLIFRFHFLHGSIGGSSFMFGVCLFVSLCYIHWMATYRYPRAWLWRP